MIKGIASKPLFLGVGISILAFVLLIIGVMMVLGNEVTIQNISAFVGFAIIVGVITAVLFKFQLKIAGTMLLLGLGLGYFEMYRAFIAGMDGWGDLIGIISLFMWAIVGLVLGLVLQIGVYLYRRYKQA